MRTLVKGGRVLMESGLVPMDVLVEDGVVIDRAPGIFSDSAQRVLDVDGLAIFPGFVDVHVHLREPGFSYKETIATGTRACARGGCTTVCAMPNLNPAPDSPQHLSAQEALIAQNAVIRVLPYGAITVGQKGEGTLSQMEEMAGRVCGFSDDGRGVKDEALMREAMARVKALNSLLAAHCEDVSLIPKGAAIHAGSFAAHRGWPGIPSESEWRPIERDLRLAEETGCRYHVCHVSCKESVRLIREAKKRGVDVTCETAPHYLLLCEDDLRDEGRFKMNPPLRAREDRDALLEGLLDGTIDMIATDHAPHSAEEKSRGLMGSAMGVVGAETAFALLYTCLVETGRVPLSLLVEKMSLAPRRRFRLDGGIQVGERAELCAFDLSARETVDPDRFLSMGRATPFAGWPVHAACRLTLCGDRVAYDNLKGANP